MTSRVRPILAGVLVALAPLPGVAQEPPGTVVPVPPAAPVARFQLGVYGTNTNKGFRVESVVVKGPATRLMLGGQRYTLETGDYITHADGKLLNKDFTLKDAIARSKGTVDLTVWSRRGPPVFDFEDVQLDLVRR